MAMGDWKYRTLMSPGSSHGSNCSMSERSWRPPRASSTTLRVWYLHAKHAGCRHGDWDVSLRLPGTPIGRHSWVSFTQLLAKIRVETIRGLLCRTLNREQEKQRGGQMLRWVSDGIIEKSRNWGRTRIEINRGKICPFLFVVMNVTGVPSEQGSVSHSETLLTVIGNYFIHHVVKVFKYYNQNKASKNTSWRGSHGSVIMITAYIISSVK